MKKQKLNITLITNDIKKKYSLLGYYDSKNRKISYQESISLLTSVIIDLKNKRLIRDNKDYHLSYNFLENEETENEIKIKDLNRSIIIKIKTTEFIVTDNKIEITYTILDSNETIHYKIEF